jgi:hypothetical protein
MMPRSGKGGTRHPGQRKDTREAMIRKHYAASILDFTDEITRKTLPSLGPAQPAASNVIPLAKR